MYVGIDVSSDRLHCVAIEDSGHVTRTSVLSAEALGALLEWCAEARTVAIDAPESLSKAPHAEDGAAPNKKFQRARCAEIGLGNKFQIWVPWVTPCEGEPCQRWMHVGFALFESMRAGRMKAIEVFPHAAFQVLAGTRLKS